MRRTFPLSFLFFLVTGIVFFLQTIPLVGLFLMALSGWPIFLVNIGMIGTAIEAGAGATSRLWLVLPIAFYGGYWGAVAWEQAVLWRLAAAYDAQNAAASFPFDPQHQALVGAGVEFTWKYALPFDYEEASSGPMSYRVHRLTEQPLCDEIAASAVARENTIRVTRFRDTEGSVEKRQSARFCIVSVPEVPTLPLVVVSSRTEPIVEDGLAVSRVTTTITGPDGRAVHLLGGYAEPLAWFPMPTAGCGLISSSPSWDCFAAFQRREPVPIASGTDRYGHARETLSRALGLPPMPPSAPRRN